MDLKASKVHKGYKVRSDRRAQRVILVTMGLLLPLVLMMLAIFLGAMIKA